MPRSSTCSLATCSRRSGTTAWISSIVRAAERHTRTVEELLGSAITASLGPFVAFGSPLDYVPPDGAARLYAADDRWENEFLDLAGRARILLTVPQCSSNLVHAVPASRNAVCTTSAPVCAAFVALSRKRLA